MKTVNLKVNLNLHENQLKIHQSEARFKYVKAGKQFGKSLLASYTLFKWATKMKPGGLFWYIAPSSVHVRDIAWHNLTRNLIDSRIYKRMLEQELYLEMINGSRIYLRGAENRERLRGPKLDGVIFDEAAYIDEYVWTGIIRSQLMASGGPAFFISTPNEKGRNWFTGACEEASRQERMGNKDYAYWKFTSYDNPTISREELENTRANTPDDVFDLEYMANESANAGVILSEFSFENHVSDTPIKEGVLVRGLDWGIAHPTACLWVKVDSVSKQVYVEDEFMKSGMLISESSGIIKQKTTREVAWSVIDPSTKKRDSQTGRRDLDEFARNGVYCVPGDNSDRGYDVMKMFFKTNSIKINPKCRNLISQIRNVQWGDKDHEDLLDCLRYTLVRVHDIMFNRFLTHQETDEKPVIQKKSYSLNDPILFPGFSTKESAIMQEINTY